MSVLSSRAAYSTLTDARYLSLTINEHSISCNLFPSSTNIKIRCSILQTAIEPCGAHLAMKIFEALASIVNAHPAYVCILVLCGMVVLLAEHVPEFPGGPIAFCFILLIFTLVSVKITFWIIDDIVQTPPPAWLQVGFGAGFATIAAVFIVFLVFVAPHSTTSGNIPRIMDSDDPNSSDPVSLLAATVAPLFEKVFGYEIVNAKFDNYIGKENKKYEIKPYEFHLKNKIITSDTLERSNNDKSRPTAPIEKTAIADKSSDGSGVTPAPEKGKSYDDCIEEAYALGNASSILDCIDKYF